MQSPKSNKRRLLVALGGALITLALAAGIRPTKARPPAFVPASGIEAPRIRFDRGYRTVHAARAPLEIVFDSVGPDAGARLLWFEGRATRPAREGSVVVDSTGALLWFSDRLSPSRPAANVGVRRLTGALGGPGESLLVVDDGGAVLRIGPDGSVESEHRTPFAYPALALDEDGLVWAVRSTDRFDLGLPGDAEPVLAKLDLAGGEVGPVGRAILPDHALLAGLANAGHIVVVGDRVFFAPFIRDELVALDRNGDTLWVASRGLPQSTPDPRFEVRDGQAVIAYHPVNLGIAVGLDHHVYLLSTPGFTTDSTRLDVFDPTDGRLLRSGFLGDPLPTLAADADGRVYRLDPDRLLAGAPKAARPVATSFDLPLLASDARLTSEGLGGKVVLVNLWASWCGPCREEMPALDALQRRLAGPDFEFIAISDDLAREDAARFIAEHGFDFPVPLGEGRMQAAFRAIGLPHTLLIDREGRIVRQWIGYTGREQIALIETLARRELSVATPGGAQAAHRGHAH
ncbi:MAG: TlpA family protein disulfide reductase [Gemmatimonadales bacterium]